MMLSAARAPRSGRFLALLAGITLPLSGQSQLGALPPPMSCTVREGVTLLRGERAEAPDPIEWKKGRTVFTIDKDGHLWEHGWRPGGLGASAGSRVSSDRGRLQSVANRQWASFEFTILLNESMTIGTIIFAFDREVTVSYADCVRTP